MGYDQTIYHEVPVFSFIFQQENMFKSVSAMENMLLTTLQSSEREEQEANERITDMAQALLPGVVLTKPIMAYSGGQRQRFAFIRLSLNRTVCFWLTNQPATSIHSKRRRPWV